MNRLSVTYEQREDRDYGRLVQRLRQHGAEPKMATQWFVQTPLSADEFRRDLQKYIDPADRLSVTRFDSMSCQNLIDDKRGSSVA